MQQHIVAKNIYKIQLMELCEQWLRVNEWVLNKICVWFSSNRENVE